MPKKKTVRQKIRMLSPALPLPGKILYVFLRATHMIISFFILPGCIWYIQHQPSGVAVSGLFAWPVVAGAVIWAMLYMMLSQFAFPGTLTGALLATGGLVMNGFTAANLGDFNLFYGAYSVAWCALAAQTLFFSGISVIALGPMLRRRFFEGLTGGYAAIPVVCTAALGAFAYVLHAPVVAEFKSETRLWLAGIYATAILWQIASEMRTLYTGSAFKNGATSQSSDVWNLYESYMPFVAIGLILSLCAALILALWETGA